MLVVCLAYAPYCRGQTLRIDSLESVLRRRQSDDDRIRTLNALAFEHFSYRPEDALRYADEALDLANESGNREGVATALTYKGIYENIGGNLPEAKSYYTRALDIATAETFVPLRAYITILMANSYRYQSKFDSASILYRQGIALLANTNEKFYLSVGYKNLGQLYRRLSKPDSALHYFRESLKLREQLGDTAMMADVWGAIGNVYLDQQDFLTAQEYFQKAEASNRSRDPGIEFAYHTNMGALMFNQGKYPLALDHYLKALDGVTSLGILEYQAELQISIGLIYENQASYGRALEYYFKALSLVEQRGYVSQRAQAYNRIAWIYKTQGNYALSEEYAKKAITIYEQVGDEPGLATCYNTLGLNYYLQRNYATSLDYHQRALAIRRRYNNRRGIAASLFNMALVYEIQGRLEAALRVQKEAIILEEETGNIYGIGISCNAIGSLLTKLGRYAEAEHYLSRAALIARDVGSRETLRDNHKFFARLYEASGNAPRALAYLQQAMALSDSLYNAETIKRITELQSLAEQERKEQEIQLLNRENALNTSKIQLQQAQLRAKNLIIIAAVAGIVLLGGLAYASFIYNRRLTRLNRTMSEQREEIMAQSEELIEANQTISSINRRLEVKVEERTFKLKEAYKELDTFFYRSSHDFRRPLTTFLGLAEVARITVKDQSALELFDKVRETAITLDKMLVKLQSISDVGAQQLVYREVFLKELLTNVCDSYRDEIEGKHIDLQLAITVDKPFASYPAMVKIIVENLIENAVQFKTGEKPFIRITAANNDTHLFITVADNGQGISKEYHDRIFDMYFRANQNAKGNGLGLYIVKKAVEKLDGSISFESEYAGGSTFRVALPLEQPAHT